MTDISVISVDEQRPELPGEWTFWADNARPSAGLFTPHTPIGPVICTSFTCSWALSGYGKAEATIPIEQGGLDRADLLRFWGWRLFAFYKGEPIWAGYPTGLSDTGGAAVTLAFDELIGYLWNKQHATTRTYTQVEQTIIADNLAARLDNISVLRILDPGPGFLRDRSYQYLEGQSRGELLTNLSEVIGGPEFRSEYVMEGGRPAAKLRIAYPRAGSDTGLGLVVPGGAAEFNAQWSGERLRTRTFAVGELPEDAPANARRPVVVVVRDQLGPPGLPAVDGVDDYPGVILRSTLQERANTNATIYAGPSLALDATVAASSPPLGTYGVGDDVNISLTDPLMPEGFTGVGRLTEMSADAAAGTVQWSVSVTQPPPKPNTRAGTLSERLSVFNSRQVNQFHRNLEPPPPGIEE